MNADFINTTFVLYLLAFILYLLRLDVRNNVSDLVGIAVLMSAGLADAFALIVRWQQAGHPPLASLSEVLLLLVFFLTVASLIMELFYRRKFGGLFAAFVGAVMLGYVSNADPDAQPLLPALQSNWLVIHVSSYLMGYAVCGLAFVTAGLSLAKSTLPAVPLEKISAAEMDRISCRLIVLAFPLLTIGLTTGSVWANAAWGRYWSWDPKETSALITWLIFLSYIELRSRRPRSVKSAAWLAIAGFLAIVFTLLVAGRIFYGLHSYR